MKKLCIFLALILLLAGCQQEVPATPTTQATLPPPTEPTACINHTDSDDNGACDTCQVSLLVTFDFYCVNDLHGKVADADTHPGVDELTTFLEKARRHNENTIVLSAGDMWQGSAESNMTRGALTTEWMNAAGFAAMTLGNHEYDWGEEPIAANAEIAQFPFLAINVYDRQTNAQVEYCQSSVVLDQNGVQIGIIGAMGDCYNSIAVAKVKDVYFLTGDDLTALVKAESEALRAQGVDFIVYVIHDGHGDSGSATAAPISNSQLRSYYDPSLSDGYVDLVFEGHTHQRYILEDDQGVFHLQNKGDNKGISQATVRINAVTGTWVCTGTKLLATGVYANMEDDPIVETLLDKYSDQLSPANEHLGYNSRLRYKNDLRQLTADMYYRLGMEVWGDEYDIVLGGGFMSVRSPGQLPAGDVTYAMLQSLLPFDNRLALCTISGKDLADKFFFTNHDSYFISFGEYGKKVRKNIDPNATYYIILDAYSYDYPPNHVTVVEEYEDGIYARDLIAQYIRDGGME